MAGLYRASDNDCPCILVCNITASGIDCPYILYVCHARQVASYPRKLCWTVSPVKDIDCPLLCAVANNDVITYTLSSMV
jgi:hypothetical protein